MRLLRVHNCPTFDKGSVLPLYIMGIMLVTIVLSFGVDLASVYAYGIYQNSNIRTAAADASEMGSSWQLKNSDTPGHFIAKEVCETLRNNGYNGSVKISFYEPSDAKLTTTGTAPNRIMCYEIELEQNYNLAFGAAIGKESISVKSSSVYSAIAYSSVNVWRPASCDNGQYTLPANNPTTALKYTANNNLSTYSVGVQEKIKELKASLT